MNGWAQRTKVSSIVWHYFVRGVAICAQHWTDSRPPYVDTIAEVRGVIEGRPCPRCVALRTNQ